MVAKKNEKHLPGEQDIQTMKIQIRKWNNKQLVDCTQLRLASKKYNFSTLASNPIRRVNFCRYCLEPQCAYHTISSLGRVLA